jgi:hypothetical protein
MSIPRELRGECFAWFAGAALMRLGPIMSGRGGGCNELPIIKKTRSSPRITRIGANEDWTGLQDMGGSTGLNFCFPHPVDPLRSCDPVQSSFLFALIRVVRGLCLFPDGVVRLNGGPVSGRIDGLPPGDGCRVFSFVAVAVTWSCGASGC